jgi:integrase
MTPLQEKMIKAMELRNLSKNTHQYYLLAVIGISRYYWQSPDKPFSRGKKPTKLPTVLSTEQIHKLINAVKNLKHRLILMTTYSAGLRISE